MCKVAKSLASKFSIKIQTVKDIIPQLRCIGKPLTHYKLICTRKNGPHSSGRRRREAPTRALFTWCEDIPS